MTKLAWRSAEEPLEKMMLKGMDSWHAVSDRASYLVLRDQIGPYSTNFYASMKDHGGKTIMIKGPHDDGSFKSAEEARSACQTAENMLQ